VSGLRDRIEAAAFRLLLFLAHALPRRALLAIGSTSGAMAGRLDRRHTKIARENLLRAYGSEMDERRAAQLTRACWRHFGRMTFDSFRFPGLDRSRLDRFVRVHGIEHIRSAQAAGRGVLLFSGHFGHWELAGVACGFYGIRLAVLARPVDNVRLEKQLARIRSCSGNLVIYKRQAIREMLRALRRGMGVALLLDQDARDHGIFVPFFGIPASTTPTLAMLALRSGAAIVPTFAVVRDDDTCDLTFEAPLRAQSTGDRRDDVRSITAKCSTILERWVRQHPEQWLWMHRRWKSEPPPGGSDKVPSVVFGASPDPDMQDDER
jgi:KDO2-lipid IV(A) lauroyltransferase